MVNFCLLFFLMKLVAVLKVCYHALKYCFTCEFFKQNFVFLFPFFSKKKVIFFNVFPKKGYIFQTKGYRKVNTQ